LRTEFLLAALEGGGDDRPNEAALAAAYGVIFEVVRGRPVTVRAMDAGGDKPLSIVEFEGEANPFLGWRGIRVLLDEPDLFRSQIRAALRAAERHEIDLRLMFPMVTTLDELRRGRELVEEVRREDHIALAHPLRIGVMIEVPAAALIADALAAEADFFSIGTNDLIQYTVAADRGNRRVDHLCRLEHPGVLRLIDVVVRAGHAQGRLVGVCGEAAGDLSALPLLVGLGVDELSVGAARVSEVRRYVRRVRWNEVQRMAAQALTLATTEDVARLVAEFVRSNDLVSAQGHTVPRSRCNIL
jgi:phosphotransferase system enzyme I (PtsI)